MKFALLEILLLLIVCAVFPENSTPCQCPASKRPWDVLQQWRAGPSMVLLGPCEFLMGASKRQAVPGDGEAPVRNIKISSAYWIDNTEVTVKAFSKFVAATGFTTTAEILGSSFNFESIPNGQQQKPKGRRSTFIWEEQKDLSWRNGTRDPRHPVVHVSWDDALAFCHWRGGDLPTEAQWEFACRGGLEQNLYPWGNELKVDGQFMTNIWQGKFPQFNTKKDGFVFTAPVGSFPANAYGLHDIVGNVWEWVKDKSRGFEDHVKLQKGGSFLCHRNHCFRYRCSARTRGSRDSTAANLGFRCVIVM